MLAQAPIPMLAQLETQLPAGQAWRYEPKLDGFRGLLWHRSANRVELLSRNSRDLGPWFPELLQAAQSLPVGTLLDGEIVMADDNGAPDFSALQSRLSGSRNQRSRVEHERAAVLVAFDTLENAGASLVEEPLAVRREHLEQLLGSRHRCLQLVEHTADVNLAEDWLRYLPMIEGVVAKRADRKYAPGRGQDWVKVKRYRTVDCVVIGVAGDTSAPKLVLGLRHADGITHHLGVSRALQPASLGPLTEMLQSLGAEQSAIPSRWQHDAVPPWRRLPAELVCEVKAASVIDAGRWLRQPATFLRWRPDLAPEDCGLYQLHQ